MVAERQCVKGHIEEQWLALVFSQESMKIIENVTILIFCCLAKLQVAVVAPEPELS